MIYAVKKNMEQLIKNSEGNLDGKTIVRFTHSTNDGAGIENHLNYLNRELLNRNAMNIIQIYIHPDNSLSTESISFGKGVLLKIPLPTVPKPIEINNPPMMRTFVKRFSSHSLYPSAIYLTDTFRFMLYCIQINVFGDSKRKLYEKRFHEVAHLDVVIKKIFTRSNVDLVVNHFAGGRDSLLLMQEAQIHSVPVLVVNHFHNRWLNYIPIREQLHLASLTAGISSQNIPRYIRKNFVNLSNGIDTCFFQKSLASPPPDFSVKYPVILLPARVDWAKGHSDILKAVCKIIKSGLKVHLIFLGRVDTIAYKDRLVRFINEHELQNYVEFIGQVNQIAVRQWYSIASIVVLPSYHEGTGRVLLEAQSMEIPPVAYKTGGTPEAIRHNETGFLVDIGNIGKLSENVAKLLKNPELRKQMGSKGRVFVENNFSIAALAQRHESIYTDVICKSKSRTGR
jgi:glycosyltransferase involved in cell wall biosynthesis